MVPQAFVPLERLPLSLSGKLDRKGLPAPAFTAAGGREPEGPVEDLLCGLFAEVLGVPGVGPDDGFFELGGDSILSIQLVARARKAGVVITPRDVFTHRTVAALALVAAPAETAPAAEGDDAGTGPVLPAPITHWLREQGGPVSGFHQSMVVQVPAALREEDLVAALQAVIDRHDALRLRLGSDNDRWTLEVSARGDVRAADCLTRHPVGRADDLRDAVTEQSEVARGTLDPWQGRVLRAVWFDRGETEPGRLLLMVHHLAVDGVSWRILLPDLTAAWQAAADGTSPDAALDPVPTSLRTWSQRLSEAAHDPARIAELPCGKPCRNPTTRPSPTAPSTRPATSMPPARI